MLLDVKLEFPQTGKGAGDGNREASFFLKGFSEPFR
jgi:hypothetical protein